MRSRTDRTNGTDRTDRTHAAFTAPHYGSASTRTNGPAARDQLVELSFNDFAQKVAALLTRLGYEDVRLVGRAAGGGRNGDGGYDIQCFLREGAARKKVIVLLKQFGRNAWVYQRMVDELRGVTLRDGADEALLITSGPISSVVEMCEGPGRVRPRVRRIDGERLRRLLAAETSPTAAGSGTNRHSYRFPIAGSANPSGNAHVSITLTVRADTRF